MYKLLILPALLCASGASFAQESSPVITAESCAVCHNESATAIPQIESLSFEELSDMLAGFVPASDTTTIMHKFVAGLTKQETEDLARYLSRKEDN